VERIRDARYEGEVAVVKQKKTMANNPPPGPTSTGVAGGVKFLHGRRPKRRTFPPDPDRDKKIAEFMAKREREKAK
jgi:hypothetical protein